MAHNNGKPKVGKHEPFISPEVLRKETELRGVKCKSEIDVICEKYGFTLEVQPAQVVLIPVKPKSEKTPEKTPEKAKA